MLKVKLALSLLFVLPIFPRVLADQPAAAPPTGAQAPAVEAPASEPAAAEEISPAPPMERGEESDAVHGSVEKPSVTEHTITLGDRELEYRATAAKMLMRDEEGKLKATVFFISYEAQTPPDVRQADRPLTFVFNGGPGAASVWLHLGTAGPKRLDLREDGEPGPPPYRLVVNEGTWLDTTDLVFIDPVGTGFSRPAPGEKREQFYGVQEDINWVADFIRLYITQYGRWISPLFLAGESYGTTRAAGLSERLLDRYGITLNGIMLISSVLDFQTLRSGGINDLPYPLFLPTYTATAWHHRRLDDELQADLGRTLAEVEAWALDDYLVALARGDQLDPEHRRAVVRRLARYTALPPEFIERTNLRIEPSAFQKQLLADELRIVGRFDSRIIGFDPDPTLHRPPYDPSLSRYLPVYSSTFNDYVRRELRYESDLPYEVLSDRVHPWRYPDARRGHLTVSDNLRSAMVKNPYLRVLFASGYYDLATPYFATDYTISQLNLGRDLQRNIAHTCYHGGHMMYHHHGSLLKLHGDVAAFIRSAAP